MVLKIGSFFVLLDLHKYLWLVFKKKILWPFFLKKKIFTAFFLKKNKKKKFFKI